MLHIKNIIEEGKELNVIRDLFREYEKELDEDICFQSFEEELKAPLKKYGPPDGDLFLATWRDEAAGCIALTKLKETGACEIKRLYVRPPFREQKIGKMLIEKLIASAKEKGYTRIRLDSLNKLEAAIRLYTNFGFKRIPAYYDNPLNGVVYMEKDL
jgi:ribosomal protein S18 acetylase RimI-like enzyme